MMNLPSIQFYIEPREYQLEGIRRCFEKKQFALFFEQGTGKTLTAINALRLFYKEQRRVLPTLILCPLIVVENWRREIEANAGQAFASRVQCLTGTAAQRRKQWARAKALDKRVFITNIEAVNTSLWQEVLSRHSWFALVIDECHKFKSHESKRTERLIGVADRIPVKLLLTGTPVTKDAMDLWAQFRILRRGLVDENFYAWREVFFEDINRGMPSNIYFPDWQLKQRTSETLKDIIKQNSMRVLKRSVMRHLPPLVNQNVYVELNAEQRKRYNEMESHFITYLNDAAMTAETALTRLLRLQQLLAGLFKSETGEEHNIESEKYRALEELLLDLCCSKQDFLALDGGVAQQNKVIVWTCFTHPYERIKAICTKLRLDYRLMIGGMNQAERQKGVDDFNTDPSVRVMIANPQAGGVGIGLQSANYAIYFAKSFNLEHYLQSAARNHRGGSEQHDCVTHIHILAKDTIDEDVSAALLRKTKTSEALIDERKDNSDFINELRQKYATR